MHKKISITVILTIFLLLSACQKNPESSAVISKNKTSSQDTVVTAPQTASGDGSGVSTAPTVFHLQMGQSVLR